MITQSQFPLGTAMACNSKGFPVIGIFLLIAAISALVILLVTKAAKKASAQTIKSNEPANI